MRAAALRIATRGSPLARWQAAAVGEALAGQGVATEMVVVSTEGDRDRTTPIWQMAGRGVFAKEVQEAVLDGRADLAVHSAKDLMSEPTPGLRLGAYLPRGDVRDALVGSTLDDLAPGATVATGSARRRAQLAHLRRDLRFVGLRGNMATRVARVDEDAEVDAVVVAAVALERLGLGGRITEWLEPEVVLPQVGQGAVVAEHRDDDGDVAAALTTIDDTETRAEVETERAFLAELGGGCELPVGALARVDGDEIVLDALLASHDGAELVRTTRRGGSTDVGVTIARVVLDGLGGRDMLAAQPPRGGRWDD